MILSLFDFPIKAARIHIKKSVELMSIMSKFLYFKFSAQLITNTRPSRRKTSEVLFHIHQIPVLPVVVGFYPKE